MAFPHSIDGIDAPERGFELPIAELRRYDGRHDNQIHAYMRYTRRHILRLLMAGPIGTGVIAAANAAEAKAWSDPSTWVAGSTNAGDVPQAGQSFEIAADAVITLDVKTPALGNVMCHGTVIVSNEVDTGIDYRSWMWMPGSKLVFADGVAGHYVRRFTLRPRGKITGTAPRMVVARTGQPAVQMGFVNNGMDRSMMFTDGAEVLGGPPVMDHHWRLADHVEVGDKSIKVRGAAVVKQGDRFVVSTTDFRGQSRSEEMTVAADASGDTITFTAAFKFFHWGKLQWVTKTGDRKGHMSLVDEGWRPANDAPYVLDESAHVIRLTRTITVDGSMDGDLGGRVMVHGNKGRLEFDGWRFTRMGGAGLQQWYGGVHHHMASYEMPDGPNSPSNGNLVGGTLASSLCAGHFVRNCCVDRSKNRGHVPHGSNGVTYDHNVYFDIVGSSLFIEEGSAQKLVINENHSILNRPATGQNILQVFDSDYGDSASAAAFWLTNPDNTVTNNSAGDCITGFWNAFTNRNPDMPLGHGCFGLSRNIRMAPGWLSILTWENNEAYAFTKKGILTDNAQGDELGNVQSDGYPDTASPAFKIAQKLVRPIMWKAFSGGYLNRVKVVQYVNAIGADVCGTIFNGATLEGSIASNGLAVCQSLNVTPRPSSAPTYDSVANSYHGSLVFPGWIVVGFRFDGYGVNDEAGTNGANLLTARSMFMMWSEYLFSMTFWVRRSPGIELLNSDFAWRTPPNHLEQEAPYNTGRPIIPNITGDLSGATMMDFPYLGGRAGLTWIYNIPFATFSAADLQEALPLGANNGMLTSSRFFGVQDVIYDDIQYPPTSLLAKRDWRRLNPADLTEVGHWTSPGGDGRTPNRGVGFLHISVMGGGLYKSIAPDIPQTYWRAVILGSRKAGNPFVLAVPFSGSRDVKVAAGTNGGYDISARSSFYASDYAVAIGVARRYTTASSLADLLNGPSNRFWQDKPNNYVYFKYEGGLVPANLIPPDREQYDQAAVSVAVSVAT